MAISPSKREGAGQGLILFVGFIIVFAALLIFLFVVRTVHSKFSTKELVPDANILQSLLPGQGASIAILYSNYLKTITEENGIKLDENIATWKIFLNTNNYVFEIITDKDIEEGNHFKYELIVLAGSISLSDLQIFQIKKYVNEGGSIFATKGTASYMEDGKWRGWDFINEVFRVKYSKEIGREDVHKIHTLRGGLSITANIPPGLPLQIDTQEKSIVVEVQNSKTRQISFWFNRHLEEGLVTGGLKNTAGMVYGNYGNGRFVWMGFDISSIIEINENNVYFNTLFNNCITWLQKKPIGFVKDWPAGYNAAAILAPTLTVDTKNINNLLPILNEEDIEATFFVEPYFANDHKELVKIISGFGEIASLVDIGYLDSLNDTLNILDDYNAQYGRLSFANQVLSNIINKKITGFLPYFGLIDENTISAGINTGYNFILVDSLTERVNPKAINWGDDKIIAITQTAKDDYEVIRSFGLTQPKYQFYTYQEDIKRVLFEGGLYVFKLHTDTQCDENNIEVVKDVISELKENNFWITTSEEVQKWYQVKGQIIVSTEQSGSSRVVVTIYNPGINVATNVIVQVDLNKKANNISIESDLLGRKNAAFSHQRDSEIINLYINDLQPEEVRTIYLDINQILS